MYPVHAAVDGWGGSSLCVARGNACCIRFGLGWGLGQVQGRATLDQVMFRITLDQVQGRLGQVRLGQVRLGQVQVYVRLGLGLGSGQVRFGLGQVEDQFYAYLMINKLFYNFCNLWAFSNLYPHGVFSILHFSH